MYHKIEQNSEDELTVSIKELDKQFEYISKRYKTVFFSELKEKNPKNIIITFDDGYKNNLYYLPSLLKKHRLKASIFIATDFIVHGYEHYEMMSFEDLRSLDRKYFEIGLHSHLHKNFRKISIEEIKQDLSENKNILTENSIPYTDVLAYPYGGYKKNKEEKNQLNQVLESLGIKYALRIGNKINFFPSANNYELYRLDIKGSDSLFKFKLKLIFGKLKPF